MPSQIRVARVSWEMLDWVKSTKELTESKFVDYDHGVVDTTDQN